VKKLIVLLMLVAAPLQAQWFSRNGAHPEKFQRMGAVDSLPAYWEYGQPKIYAQWWTEIAKCEDLPLPDSRKDVRFFEVNGKVFMPAGFMFWLDGATYPASNEIYLTSLYVLDEAVVKHEMLHWLLWDAGFRLKSFHPIEMFETCGIHRTGP
jgi:hypothetical protein